MGVPFLFKWLIDNYTQYELIYGSYPYKDGIDNLYIDMNGCIHKAGRNDSIKTIDEMITRIIEYLDGIVHTSNVPNKVLYVGIDGVAPGGKLFQQKKRG